ncbi:hypothetical protein MRX96_022809 [Rhipicephalus microplus]
MAASDKRRRPLARNAGRRNSAGYRRPKGTIALPKRFAASQGRGPPRQDARNQETSREPRYAKENCEPRAAAPRVENSEPPRREERRRGDGWREEKEFLQARDRRRAPRDTRDDYPMQEYSRRERSPGELFRETPDTRC